MSPAGLGHSTSNNRGCPPVREDNPRALADKWVVRLYVKLSSWIILRTSGHMGCPPLREAKLVDYLTYRRTNWLSACT